MTWTLAEPDASLESVLPARSKARAVDGAVRDLLNRMKVSRKAANFGFAYVSFHEAVSEERPAADLLTVDTAASFDPTSKGTGGTRLASGLEAAIPIIE